MSAGGELKPVVLAADDDEDILELVAFRLERSGYTVLRARDGEEALRLAEEQTPDIAVLDVGMPKLDGLEVLRAVRTNSRTSTAPVVVLTASDDPRELAQCYQLGANSCVQKPVQFEDLRSVLQSIARYWLGLNQPPPGPAVPLL